MRLRVEMKHVLGISRLAAVGLLALTALALVGPASADTAAYRLPMFGCADGAPGFNLVPANTPLYVQSGWSSGTRGLVQSAIKNTTSTVVDLRNGASAVYSPVWGPIEPAEGGGWIARWQVYLPPLPLGGTATVTETQSFAHPQADVGLPVGDDDLAGLQYRTLWAAGILALGGEPNPTVCTITAI
jgi:hypothetical protein